MTELQNIFVLLFNQLTSLLADLHVDMPRVCIQYWARQFLLSTQGLVSRSRQHSFTSSAKDNIPCRSVSAYRNRMSSTSVRPAAVRLFSPQVTGAQMEKRKMLFHRVALLGDSACHDRSSSLHSG